MAAGLGFKDFQTGEVLTAADVDGYLMQGVWVFASATARDAAVTSPQEGNFAYLKDTNVTTYYTGSAWANLDTTGMTNPMTTTGDTIYSSSGSTPARLGIGTAGQVLTVNSGATAPEWAAPAGGGKVLQVVSTAKTDSFSASTSAGVYTDITGLSVSITPSSATSKILVIAMVSGSGAIGSNFAAVQLVRASTAIALADTAGSRLSSSSQLAQIAADAMTALPITFLDSPATTSSTTYKIQGCSAGGTGTVYINRSTNDTNNSSAIRGVSTITVLEIGA
jgi:hypothetical protein